MTFRDSPIPAGTPSSTVRTTSPPPFSDLLDHPRRTPPLPGPTERPTLRPAPRLAPRAPTLWLLALGLLLAACGGQCGASSEMPKQRCSLHTPCKAGYKCEVVGGGPPVNPGDLGRCEKDPCAVIQPCEEPHGQPCINNLIEGCDIHDPDRFCQCIGLNSEEVPTPTTDAAPTTGDSP